MANMPSEVLELALHDATINASLRKAEVQDLSPRETLTLIIVDLQHVHEGMKEEFIRRAKEQMPPIHIHNDDGTQVVTLKRIE